MRLPIVTLTVACAIGTATALAQAQAKTKTAAAPIPIVVYKTPTCGCCAKWIQHMEANGFKATVFDVSDTAPERARRGVPAHLGSCHTAVVDRYAIEGHVPAADITRLLREKANIAGLAAPGMPAGSPGMDVPNSPAYDVLTFDKQGRTTVYATHR